MRASVRFLMNSKPLQPVDPTAMLVPILSEAMKKYLKGALVKPPDLINCEG